MMLKRCLLAAGLCLCLALGLRVPAEAAETAASGTCGVEGANVTWVLDTEGTLTLSGTGKMADYVSTSGGGPPWDDRKSSVKKIVIGEGVTGVGSWAFMSCTALTELTIPQGVTSIGEAAFYGCEALEKVTIPGSVTSMGNSVFGSCGGLRTAGPAGGGSGYDIEFGWTEAIPANAFSDCASLTEVTIPEGVTGIGDSAFLGCGALTKVAIPQSVAGIGSQAFMQCKALTELAIPQGVTGIGEKAFYGCEALEKVTIPGSVTSMGSSVFGSCGGLKTAGPAGGGYDIEFGWTEAVPAYAFANCASLTEVTIPEGITSIGENAFTLTALTAVTIPQGVASIGGSAFYGCEALEKVTIPGSVTSMGSSVFGSCGGLKTAGPAGGGYDIEFGWKEAIPAGAFMNCRSLTAVTIPQGVTSIGDRAFQNCGLTGVTIPAGVTAIGAGTFSGCFSLKEIAIPEGVTGIGDNAFYFCMFLTEAVIPASVTRIGEAAFDLCGLERISFGGGRRQWGALAAAQDIGVEESVSFTYGVESYTVSYVPDGGTGEKAPELFDRGDLLTLPGADAFAAPVGRSFKAWRVDGVERAPGETQTVTKDMTVTAVWRTSGPVTAALSADGRQAELTAPADVLRAGAEVFAARYSGGRLAECVTVSLPAGGKTAAFPKRLDKGWRLFLLSPGTKVPLCGEVRWA